MRQLKIVHFSYWTVYYKLKVITYNYNSFSAGNIPTSYKKYLTLLLSLFLYNIKIMLTISKNYIRFYIVTKNILAGISSK